MIGEEEFVARVCAEAERELRARARDAGADAAPFVPRDGALARRAAVVYEVARDGERRGCTGPYLDDAAIDLGAVLRATGRENDGDPVGYAVIDGVGDVLVAAHARLRVARGHAPDVWEFLALADLTPSQLREYARLGELRFREDGLLTHASAVAWLRAHGHPGLDRVATDPDPHEVPPPDREDAR